MSTSRETLLAEKVSFFKQLKRLLPPSDGSLDIDDALDDKELQQRHRSRRFFETLQSSEARVTSCNHDSEAVLDRLELPKHSEATGARRVISDPTPARRLDVGIVKGTPDGVAPFKGRLDALLRSETTVILETPNDGPSLGGKRLRQAALQRSMTTPLSVTKRSLLESPSVDAVRKRKKRNAAQQTIPEVDLIFQNLTFYYVPNNEIAPARKLRISKAKEYGATRVANIAEATHIVVDREITYQDVESLLKKEARRGHRLKVVNENYPIDCIQFKSLLDHDQRKYQLVGQPADHHEAEHEKRNEIEPVIPSSTVLDSVDALLPLKGPQRNPKRWDYASLPGTPARSHEPSQSSRISQTPITVNAKPSVRALPEAVKPVDTNLQKVDELSQCITMMQGFKDLPIDTEDGEVLDSFVMSNDLSLTNGAIHVSLSSPEQTHPATRGQAKRRLKEITFEAKFACNEASEKDMASENPNTRTIEVLQQMADYYDRVEDQWRTQGYRKAITALKRQTVKISTKEEALRIPSIGLRIAEKLEEIVTTNRLRRLELAQDEPTDQAFQLFLGIYGVGPVQASQWITQGFRTLDDVKAKAKLTSNQLFGLDNYQDLNTRIPRQEIEALGAFVRRVGATIDESVEFIIGGSYRRGSDTSNDIDLVVTKPGTNTATELRTFLHALVSKLEKAGFLVARLSGGASDDSGSKWHGCCVLPDAVADDMSHNANAKRHLRRRIDFLLVPESELGAALIYFTGNDIFNRSMRLLASRKGMRLNQRGLYADSSRARGRSRKRVGAGEGLLEGRDERRIFEILGVNWREPHERWC